jgi:hypothetical protein
VNTEVRYESHNPWHSVYVILFLEDKSLNPEPEPLDVFNFSDKVDHIWRKIGQTISRLFTFESHRIIFQGTTIMLYSRGGQTVLLAGQI